MTYREGARGEVVRQIQKALKLYPDGIWGRLTTEAVRVFQRSKGLSADGIAGPKTLALLLPKRFGNQSPKKANPNIGNLDSVTACYGGLSVTLKRSKRRIDEIIVHCTATPEGQPRTVEQIRAQHKAQGYSDIGYHLVVYRDGSVHEGRDVDIAGAHATNHNAHSIGVVYVGGVENRPGVPYAQLKPKDTRTEQQKASLLALLMDLRKLYPTARIIGHRDVSSKACPSFDAKSEYRRV